MLHRPSGVAREQQDGGEGQEASMAAFTCLGSHSLLHSHATLKRWLRCRRLLLTAAARWRLLGTLGSMPINAAFKSAHLHDPPKGPAIAACLDTEQPRGLGQGTLEKGSGTQQARRQPPALLWTWILCANSTTDRIAGSPSSGEQLRRLLQGPRALPLRKQKYMGTRPPPLTLMQRQNRKDTAT
jgi:hypothetical protein